MFNNSSFVVIFISIWLLQCVEPQGNLEYYFNNMLCSTLAGEACNELQNSWMGPYSVEQHLMFAVTMCSQGLIGASLSKQCQCILHDIAYKNSCFALLILFKSSCRIRVATRHFAHHVWRLSWIDLCNKTSVPWGPTLSSVPLMVTCLQCIDWHCYTPCFGATQATIKNFVLPDIFITLKSNQRNSVHCFLLFNSTQA
jgi:hypothetical protein